jgi:glyoxylate reductase
MTSRERPLVLLNKRFEESIHAELVPPFDAAELRVIDFGVVDAFSASSAEDAADAARVRGLLVHGHVRVDAALLARFPSLRVVSNHGVGIDHIDVAACSAARVRVYNTPDAVTGATADCAFALLLAAARRVVEGDALARAPETFHFSPIWFGAEVHGQTIGIVGMGRIGAAVARRARGFDMRVLYHNRRRAAPEVEASLGGGVDGGGIGGNGGDNGGGNDNAAGCRFCVTLDEMLPQCDFVVVCAPATPETRHLVGAPQLARMRRTAFLVNISRGSLVDQDALVAALDGGAIAGAALDVTDPEPLPRDHALLRCSNLTLTPHVGTATRKTRAKMCALALANLAAGLGSGEAAQAPAPLGAAAPTAAVNEEALRQ